MIEKCPTCTGEVMGPVEPVRALKQRKILIRYPSFGESGIGEVILRAFQLSFSYGIRHVGVLLQIIALVDQ